MAVPVEPTQRHFAVMGTNIFNITNKLMQNQRICRLLKYQDRDPFSKEKHPDVDGIELINKQILITPKLFDDSTEKMSYITVVATNMVPNLMNPEFKRSTLCFNVACPLDEWVLDDESLRPYLIMQEIDTMFNRSKIAGIGTMKFTSANTVVLTPWLGGYSMLYTIDEFN